MNLEIWKVQKAITKSNVTVYDPPLRGLWLLSTGTVTVADKNGTQILWNITSAPFFITLEIYQVRSTGTNIADADMVGGW